MQTGTIEPATTGRVEKSILCFLVVVVLGSVGIFLVNEPFFAERVVMEDGPIEWMTVIGLLCCAGLCLSRFVRGRREQRKALFLTGLLGSAALFTFGAGEEISWGQRLFGIESPEFFDQNNEQGETNLHNLVVGDTKINRLVFGKILAVAICSFAFLLPWMWTQSSRIRDLTARFAVPIPRLKYSLIYLALFLIIEATDHRKKGELVEFAGSVIFFLMIFNPLNADVFRRPTAEKQEEIVESDSPDLRVAA